MVNFKKLSSSARSEAPATLGELFGQLDRKTTHSSLRPVQVSAFKALDAVSDQRDVVLKLSTGSGKTVVGLVFAEMMRRRYKGDPSVFLCATNQLVEQVVQAGALIGVSVVPFKGSNQFDALSGDAILACTYDRVFNSRSVFVSRDIRPSCFVMDDVHAGVDRIKGCYTTKIPDALYGSVVDMLSPLCSPTDPAVWHVIRTGAGNSVYEVPFSIWANIYKQVLPLLEQYKDNDKEDLFFRWGNISRYLELARVCVSSSQVEISLPIAAVEENPAYVNAKHRLFMSASIKDGSSLVSDLACSLDALKRVIDPPEDEGAGERMILPTSLIDHGAQKSDISEVCATIAAQTNVVVLTSSGAQASTWVDAGAEYFDKGNVDAAILKLRTSNPNFVVFAQRFDGVDLPDDACRLLVIDGVPSGDRLCDRVDAERQKGSPGHNIRTVNRFEQALGRAVRSNADYAAVMLVGPEIAAFIGTKSVRDLFEGRTRTQADLGRELAKLESGGKLSDVLVDLVEALLSRNEDWKEQHRSRVKSAPRLSRAPNELTVHELVGSALREAWLAAKSRNFQDAVSKLQAATNLAGIDPVQKAELLYRIAAYLQQFDASAAMATYRSAFQLNSAFPRPEQAADKKFVRIGEQALSIAKYFEKFISPNAALARLDEIKAKLGYAMGADTVEQGLKELGEALGAASSRPERETGRGPDVMWLFPDFAFCIEAKNEKSSPISKSDAGQLMLSRQWCTEHAEVSSVIPVFATNVTTADRAEDVAFRPFLMSEDSAMTLLEALRSLVVGLSFDGPLFTNPAQIGAALSSRNLLGKQIQNGWPEL